MTTACSGTVWWQRWTGLESIPCVWLSLAFPDLLKILSDSFLWNLSRYAYWHILQTTCSEDFFWGGVIYGGHPSALLSSRQCHELRPTFPYADLKHFGLPSSPDSSAFFFKKSVEPLKAILHCLLQRLSCVSSYGLASSQFRLLKRLPVIWFICKTLAA